MANTNTPFGFKYIGRGAGATPNYALQTAFVLNTATAIYQGDPLTLTAGRVSQAAVVGGGAQLAGVADGYFHWQSITQKRPIYLNWWPGTADSQGGADIDCRITCDPNGLYEAQATTGQITQSNVGQFLNFSAGTGGNTIFGTSSYSANDGTLNAVQGNLPFKVVNIEALPVTDPTSVNNKVQVQCVNLNAFV